jgi:hypothetical protein
MFMDSSEAISSARSYPSLINDCVTKARCPKPVKSAERKPAHWHCRPEARRQEILDAALEVADDPSNLGYNVVSANDGVEALDILRKRIYTRRCKGRLSIVPSARATAI